MRLATCLKVSAVESGSLNFRAAIKIYATFLFTARSIARRKDYFPANVENMISSSLLGFLCFYGFRVDSYVIKQRFLPFSQIGFSVK